MNALAPVPPANLPNIVQLPVRKKAPQAEQRFKIVEFVNPRTGSTSWRVSGIKRDGSRIRENFKDEPGARCRQIDLETEYLQGHSDPAIQATTLRPEQLRLAEAAFTQLGDDWPRLLDAVSTWKTSAHRNAPTDTPRLDDAIEQYQQWLEASPFRAATKRNWKFRINVFKNSVQNVRVGEITPEFIDQFLASRKTSAVGKDTDRRAVSRFFSWCIERPRRWAITNPCREVKISRDEVSAPPAVLNVEDCKKLLSAAQQHKNGLLVPYVAVCLFAGLRPFEASRLTWGQVNMEDNEIRLEANQSKDKRSRVVTINETLKKWLKACQGKDFYPANWRKEFDAVREAAKITEWPHDVMRHTAISHYFRQSGSYGKTAEQFGNSETIIKRHYQGRVSSEETKQFYAIKPAKKAGV